MPRKRIADTIGRLRNEIAELDVSEALLLGTHESPDNPDALLSKLLREQFGTTTPEEDLHHSWNSIHALYGDTVPAITDDRIADKLQERFDKIQADRERLTARVLGYASIFEEWPVPPAIEDNRAQYVDVDATIVSNVTKLSPQTKYRKNPNRAGERREAEEDVSEKIITFLINNAGTFFTYDEIAETVYESKLPDGRIRDNRIGTTFHNNLRNPNQENIFERFLGDDWVLVKGKRIPLDPKTGKPPLKYKPRVCYKAIPRDEAERLAS